MTCEITHTCIIIDDAQRLRDFYRTGLGIEAKEYTEHYVEFPMEHVKLSLYSLTEHEGRAPGSAMAASNKSIMLVSGPGWESLELIYPCFHRMKADSVCTMR